jgi:nitrogen fixation/metabolism regulation signal transduction histidine kinase
MTIRTKLVAAFLLIALLVPVLGGIGFSRVQRINNDVKELSDEAVPSVLLAADLDATQREQQRAVLAYALGGAAAERQRYYDLVPQVDQKLADLTSAVSRGGVDEAAVSSELARQIADERVKFDTAAEQMIDSRATIERHVENVRVRAEEMVLELTILRSRFSPGATAQSPSQAAAARGGTPITLQSQINELLFGLEGMMSIVAFESAISSGYTLTLNPALRQRFEDAAAAWANFLQTAKNTGGPEDLPIISRVETKFAKDFEPSARTLMATADTAARARGAFMEASAVISSRLGEMVEVQSGKLAAAQSDAQSTAGNTGRLMVAVTLIAFMLAGALGVWFAGTITRPIRQLRDVANRISTGDLANVEIDVDSKDEVADLAGAFRRMMASIRFLMRDGVDRDSGASAAQSSPLA